MNSTPTQKKTAETPGAVPVKRKKKSCCCAVALVVAIAVLSFLLFLARFLLNEVREMTTRDSMGRIAVALDERNSHDTSQLIGDVVRKFPTPHAETMILDGWGNPIAICAENGTDGCQLSCSSPGPDKTPGTDDDIVEVFWVATNENPWIPSP